MPAKKHGPYMYLPWVPAFAGTTLRPISTRISICKFALTAVSRLKLAAALALAALVLTGCSQNKDSRAPVPARYAASEDKFGYADVSRTEASRDTAAAAPQGAGGRHLAITYHFSLLAPENDIAALQQKHLAECQRLGCEVLNTSLDRSLKDNISAYTSVRIAPEAFPAFEQTISAPPIEVAYRGETSEDKTLPLLDAEKRLEVKTLLRDRLTAMLREPGQKSPADIAAIERQIAEVQGEIESATAQRDYLRKVTQTMQVDIRYRSVSARLGGVNFSPVADAASNAARTFTNSVAALIVFTIWIVPWIPVAMLVFWIVRRLWRRGRPA